jgi:ribosomal protein S18 acetylase RimI-like enzyme
MVTHENAPRALDWPEAPAIPGVHLRTWRGHADLEILAEVHRRDRVSYGIDQVVSASELAKTAVARSGFDPDEDLQLVEVDGEAIGWKNVFWLEDKGGRRNYWHAGWVLPEWRGRGIGKAMMLHSERLLVETAKTHLAAGQITAGAAFFRTRAAGAQTDLQALLSGLGYAPVRHSYNMVRPHLEDIPNLPLPPGIEIRPAHPEQYRQIWRAAAEAFSDHFGANDTIKDEDYDWWLAQPYFQPELWQVAWDGDEVAGMILNYIPENENREFNRLRGYTEEISVRKPWRRRGLARALHARSLKLLREHGMQEAALSVDTENETGALRLYESMGFRQVRHSILFDKPLD